MNGLRLADRASRRPRTWGAYADEVASTLPGDELLSRVDVTSTRAITVRAPSGAVWPWIAQLGQGRGGFYSYDALENVVGCRIHSAQAVVPDWQHVEVGDTVHLHPTVSLEVAVVLPGRALVLHGGVPVSGSAPPYDSTWAWILREAPDGTTRLVVRERYAYTGPWAGLIVRPVQLVSFVMSQKMLRTIKERAERPSVVQHPKGVAVHEAGP